MYIVQLPNTLASQEVLDNVFVREKLVAQSNGPERPHDCS